MGDIEMGEIWTIGSYAIYNAALRASDKELQTEKILHLTEVIALNDRRYTEVGVEKEKALKIKEIADLSALELARESQVNKDERNDAMREQNLKETGVYATRNDLAEVVTRIEKTLRPLVDYVSNQQGKDVGSSNKSSSIVQGIVIGSVILGIFGTVISLVIKFI